MRCQLDVFLPFLGWLKGKPQGKPPSLSFFCLGGSLQKRHTQIETFQLPFVGKHDSKLTEDFIYQQIGGKLCSSSCFSSKGKGFSKMLGLFSGPLLIGAVARPTSLFLARVFDKANSKGSTTSHVSGCAPPSLTQVPAFLPMENHPDICDTVSRSRGFITLEGSPLAQPKTRCRTMVLPLRPMPKRSRNAIAHLFACLLRNRVLSFPHLLFGCGQMSLFSFAYPSKPATCLKAGRLSNLLLASL